MRNLITHLLACLGGAIIAFTIVALEDGLQKLGVVPGPAIAPPVVPAEPNVWIQAFDDAYSAEQQVEILLDTTKESQWRDASDALLQHPRASAVLLVQVLRKEEIDFRVEHTLVSSLAKIIMANPEFESLLEEDKPLFGLRLENRVNNAVLEAKRLKKENPLLEV